MIVWTMMQLGGGGGQLPQWATSLIIFGSCVLVTTLVLAAGRIVHYVADRHAGKRSLDQRSCLVLLVGHQWTLCFWVRTAVCGSKEYCTSDF